MPSHRGLCGMEEDGRIVNKGPQSADTDYRLWRSAEGFIDSCPQPKITPRPLSALRREKLVAMAKEGQLAKDALSSPKRLKKRRQNSASLIRSVGCNPRPCASPGLGAVGTR